MSSTESKTEIYEEGELRPCQTCAEPCKQCCGLVVVDDDDDDGADVWLCAKCCCDEKGEAVSNQPEVDAWLAGRTTEIPKAVQEWIDGLCEESRKRVLEVLAVKKQ